MNEFILFDWNSEDVDAHRRGKSDMQWARENIKDRPLYSCGDVIEFMVGGFGKIEEVGGGEGGWPFSYSTREINGRPFHKRGICAWHYDGDIKRKIPEDGIAVFLNKRGEAIKPHPLLDTIKEIMSIKSDAELGKLLGIASPVVSKIRNRRLEVGATFILAIHDSCGMEIKNIKALIESSKETK